METLRQDIKYGVRMLLKDPRFTLIAVAALALGIGANTAIFSVVNAALLQSYPHLETDRWVYLWERPNLEGLSQVAASVPNYRDWKEQNRSFTETALWLPWNYNLSGSGEGEPERVNASVVTANLFTALNLTPAAGRMLTDDDGKSAERLIVISYGLWQRRFAGDPNLPGKQIDLNLVPHTVVGVAPQGFSFPPETKIDVWSIYAQSAIDSDTDRSARGFRVAAKLKPDASLTSAQSEMNVIAERLAAQHQENKNFGVQVVSMREGVAGDFQTPLLILFGALGFVLLLTCVNLANLQLVQLEARRKELAMRSALGAARFRLIRQLITESLLPVIAAGVLGIWLAPEGVKLLLWFVPPEQVPWLKVETDGRVLLVSAGLALLTAILIGALPAIRASRFNLTRMLAAGGSVSGGTGVSRHRRNVFVIAQLALTVIPLAGAALMANSYVRLRRVDPGFRTDNRLTLSFSAPRARYKDPAAVARLAQRIREEVRQAPGIEEAGLVQSLPFSPAVSWLQAVSRQDPKGNPADLPHVRYTVAGAGYFESLNIPLKAGRTITDADLSGTEQVVIINESLAKKYFPNEDPIGKPLWIGHAQALPGSAPRTIVGVVGDALRDRLDIAPEAAAWVPILQQSSSEGIWRNLFLTAHAKIDPMSALASVRQRIAGVDAELALTNIATMEDRLGESIWRQRFTAGVLSAFSLIAIGIAALGVFGVASYLVSQRTKEIGVRMALGAQPGDIFRMVMIEGIASALIGTAIGIAGALLLTRFLTSLLYGVSANDPVTFAAAAILPALAAIAACWIPARRAAKVDPMVALRYE